MIIKLKEGDILAQFLSNGEIRPVEISEVDSRGKVIGIYTGTLRGYGIEKGSLQHVLPGDFEKGFRKEIQLKKETRRVTNQS